MPLIIVGTTPKGLACWVVGRVGSREIGKSDIAVQFCKQRIWDAYILVNVEF